MNKSKSIKRKHKMRTLRRRSARQFRGGAAATLDIISFIPSGDNKIITTIIIAALFSGIYKQNATFMFKIAIEHILNGLTRDNIEYFCRVMNVSPNNVDKALKYAHHPYTPAAEIDGGSRRRTKHRLHLRRKSHKYKLQSGGDRNSAIIAAMLFLFIISCWSLYSVLLDLTAPQLSNTLKDMPGAIGDTIPNIPFSGPFSVDSKSLLVDADYQDNIRRIFNALDILIANLNGFPTPKFSTGQMLKTAYTGVLPSEEVIQSHFVGAVNNSLTTPICTAAMKAIGDGLHNLSNIANKNRYIPSVPSWLGGYTDVTYGSNGNERDILTAGWTLGTLKTILETIIPQELASQFSKGITDRAQHIILSSSGALVSFAFMFVLLLREMTRSMTSRRSKRAPTPPPQEIEKVTRLVAAPVFESPIESPTYPYAASSSGEQVAPHDHIVRTPSSSSLSPPPSSSLLSPPPSSSSSTPPPKKIHWMLP